MGLNFNCAFIVVLVMRKCLNFLRARALASLLPFDEAIDLHKLVGVVIALQSVGHTLAHFGNLCEYLAGGDSMVTMHADVGAHGWSHGSHAFMLARRDTETK